MHKIIAVLALAIATLVASVVQAVEPSSLSSLQPFTSFPKGAGEGVAYEYNPRTKAQLVALLRNPKLAKKEMRVTCNVLVRQMVEGHKVLPFEGCEGAAAAIERDDNFVVVSCRDEMFRRDNWLIVTNKAGSAFGVWHRKCLPNEQVLVYKGQSVISLTCLNVAIPTVSPPPDMMVTCANLYATVPAGLARTVRFTLIRKTALPDFNCWGVVERQWRTGSPHDCDWCEWTDDGVLEMKHRYGGNFDFFHTSIYTMHPDVDTSGKARSTEVTIVLPLAAINEGVAVCVEVDGVIYPAAFVLPPTWRKGEVRIPADFWTNPRVINP